MDYKNLKSGSIVEYCNEYFEVKENFGNSGVVYELNDKFDRTGTIITNFKWSVYGTDCNIIGL